MYCFEVEVVTSQNLCERGDSYRDPDAVQARILPNVALPSRLQLRVLDVDAEAIVAMTMERIKTLLICNRGEITVSPKRRRHGRQ